jgi:hypothetical protein
MTAEITVADRVTVEGAGVETTDEVRAGLDGGVEQLRGAWIAQDPRLGEGDHLHVRARRVRLPCRRHSLEALQTAIGVDLGVTADHRGTGGDRRRERAGRPLPDRTSCRPPALAIVADQPGQPRLGGVGTERQAQTRRIEMGVDVGEGGEQHATAAVGDCHPVRRWPAGDAAVADHHVHQTPARLAWPRSNTPQQQIPHHRECSALLRSSAR